MEELMNSSLVNDIIENPFSDKLELRVTEPVRISVSGSLDMLSRVTINIGRP